jgi:FkbM family methyltransferase
MGETFASRVAASILNTMDLAELVTISDENYFNVALSLAQNTEKLATIKQKIAVQKQISPLFDTSKFAHDLERLYQSIWEQELRGARKPILLQPEEINPLAQIDTPENDFLTLSTAIESSSAKESISEINHVHLSPLLELLKPERLTHVVDIGANPIDGDPPYKSMLTEKLCFVTGFEPQESALAELLSKKTGNERYLPYAVGDGQSHTLKVCRASGLTSLFEPDLSTLDLFDALKPLAEVTQRIEMTTRKLDDVTEIENIDFLKIDIQGAELSVFQHGIKKLAKTVAIQVEVSFVTLYENQPTLGDIDIELRRQGFIPHCFAAVKKWVIAPCILNNNPRQPLNQLLEADIVYVRDFSKPELMSDEQLKQLAIVAHYCYGSHDLALRCIMNLEKRKTLALGSQTQYLKII